MSNLRFTQTPPHSPSLNVKTEVKYCLTLLSENQSKCIHFKTSTTLHSAPERRFDVTGSVISQVIVRLHTGTSTANTDPTQAITYLLGAARVARGVAQGMAWVGSGIRTN